MANPDNVPDTLARVLDDATDDLAALINRALANAQDCILELAEDLALMRELMEASRGGSVG